MRELDKPIGQVFRRLRFQRFLVALVWGLAATLLGAAIAFGVEKAMLRELPGPDWAPFAIASGVAFLIAAGVALFSGPNRVDAAVAIDRSFHLNERLSSVLTLPGDLKDTPAGQALLADTLRHVKDLDIGSKFGLHVPRKAWVPLVPGVMAVGLMLLPATWLQTKTQAKAAANREAESKAIKKETESLNKSIARKREEMDKNQFPEAEKILAQIQKASEELSKSPPNEKDKALVELNKLTDAVKDRQKQIGDAQQIQKQLQQLKEMTSNGPSDQFAKDLAKGDFQNATKELQKLQDKLLSGKMSDTEKKQLNQQLKEMQKKLEQMANMEQRKKQLEEADIIVVNKTDILDAARLDRLTSFGLPLLVGASRKRFIDWVSPAEPQARLGGSIAAHLIAAENGAAIIRTHDVAPTIQALRAAQAIRSRR